MPKHIWDNPNKQQFITNPRIYNFAYMFMAHLKEIFFIFLDFIGFGSAGIQIAIAIDDLIKSQGEQLKIEGLTNSHENILFWVNIIKAVILFLLSAVYIGFRIYVYYKKHIRKA